MTISKNYGTTESMKNSPTTLMLPPCGMWFGAQFSDTRLNRLIRSGRTHTLWISEDRTVAEWLERFVVDKQGNFAQLLGEFDTDPRGTWRDFKLDELGVPEPLPNWEQRKNICFRSGSDYAEYRSTRYGAWLIDLLRRAKKHGVAIAALYVNGAPEQTEQLTGFDNYIGYNIGERNVIGCPEARNLREIADDFLRRVKATVAARKNAGWGRLLTTSTSFYVDYEIAAGVDIPLCEDFAFRNLAFSSAISRGLFRRYHLEFWGSHIAHEHYSWISFANPRKFPLLKAAFRMKYMHGAKLIVNESGSTHLKAQMAPDAPMRSTVRVELGGIYDIEPERYAHLVSAAKRGYPTINYSSPVARKYRETIADFYEFIQRNGTPSGQPETTFAVIKGDCDLTAVPGVDANTAIGNAEKLAEQNANYFGGAPERGWEIVKKLFAPCPPVFGGELNQYLAANPYGLFDIVSFANGEPELEMLRRYRLLIFSGWNSANEGQHRLLLDYVRGGGTVALGIPHLSTGVDRNIAGYGVGDLLFDGDFSELCGVRVTGRGKRVYWAENANCSGSGYMLPHRMGVLNVRIGDLEIVDPAIKTLAAEDETFQPLVFERACGKGKVFFINCWNYPGAMDTDEGPGALEQPNGLITSLYRYLAETVPGTVRISENGAPSQYVAHSYFPEEGKLCLLNLDFDHPRMVEAASAVRRKKFELEPAGFRLINWNI